MTSPAARRLGDPLAVTEGGVCERGLQPRRQGPGRRLQRRGIIGGGGVILYDVAGRRRLGDPLAVTEGGVSSVAFSPDGKALAAGLHASASAAAAG